MRRPLRPFMIAGLLCAAVTGVTPAEAAPRLDLSLPSYAGAAPQAVVTAAGVPAAPTPDLAVPLDPQARPRLLVDPLNSEMFARTSVDRHFGKADGGVTAAAGVLCGRQQGHGDSGGSAAFGVDPHGRFVGGKLSFAF